MAFWSEKNTEPKRLFKFVVSIGGLSGVSSLVIPSWIARNCDRPKFDVTEQSLQFLDKKFKYPGKVNWTDVTLTLVEPVTPSENPSKILYNNLILSGYRSPAGAALGAVVQGQSNIGATGSAELATISKLKSVMLTFDIKLVDPQGLVLETWSLKNAWVKNYNFAKLDYEQDAFSTIDLTVAYDWAEFA